MLSVVILNIVTLNVILPSVVKLNVVMLSVVAPSFERGQQIGQTEKHFYSFPTWRSGICPNEYSPNKIICMCSKNY
jgi:hypothetical protein